MVVRTKILLVLKEQQILYTKTIVYTMVLSIHIHFHVNRSHSFQNRLNEMAGNVSYLPRTSMVSLSERPGFDSQALMRDGDLSHIFCFTLGFSNYDVTFNQTVFPGPCTVHNSTQRCQT